MNKMYDITKMVYLGKSSCIITHQLRARKFSLRQWVKQVFTEARVGLFYYRSRSRQLYFNHFIRTCTKVEFKLRVSTLLKELQINTTYFVTKYSKKEKIKMINIPRTFFLRAVPRRTLNVNINGPPRTILRGGS